MTSAKTDSTWSGENAALSPQQSFLVANVIYNKGYIINITHDKNIIMMGFTKKRPRTIKTIRSVRAAIPGKKNAINSSTSVSSMVGLVDIKYT